MGATIMVRSRCPRSAVLGVLASRAAPMAPTPMATVASVTRARSKKALALNDDSKRAVIPLTSAPISTISSPPA